MSEYIVSIIIFILFIVIIIAGLYYYLNVLEILHRQSWLWSIPTFFLNLLFGFGIIPIVIFYNRYELDEHSKKIFKMFFWIFPFVFAIGVLPSYLEYKSDTEYEQEKQQEMAMELTNDTQNSTIEQNNIKNSVVSEPNQASNTNNSELSAQQPIISKNAISKKDINSEIIEIVAETQKQLPVMLNDDTEVFEVSAGNKKMIYSYRLVNTENNQDLQDYINSNEAKGLLLSNNICKVDKDMTRLIKKGVSIYFRYYDMYDDYVGEAQITKKDCRF